jgi:phosphatidylglycerophosphate synthase
VRTVLAGPVIGLIAQALLLAALAATVGLGAAGWAVGGVCAVLGDAALARGIVLYRARRLSPADWVTLTRASLAVGVAALAADSFERPEPVATLFALSAIALSLDALDGWLVRRTGIASTVGAHFDGEVDAFLIAVLSVYVARADGWWVLAIGAARYAFLAAGWLLPWMRDALPPRHWRKTVAATQGIVLAIAAADFLPRDLIVVALVGALALLTESFGRDVWWLWSHRHAQRAQPAAPVTRGSARGPVAPERPRRGRARARIATGFSILALLVVWAALVAPDQLNRLTPSAFLRVPLEGLAVVALALVLPTAPRRVLACILGPLLGLLVIVKLLDMGFFEAFDRPFNPIADGSYTGIGIETMRDSIGRTEANLVVAGAAVLAIGLLVVTTLALLRLTGAAASHRRLSLPTIATLGLVWGICWVFGVQAVSGAPIASTSAAGLVVREVRAVQAGLDDHAVFADEIRHDSFRSTPTRQLLAGLRGKDVLLVFVESYGQVAVENSSIAAQDDRSLAKQTRQLQASGFSARSGWLASSTFGGLSWLAHSTLQSGLWVDNQLRYDQLVATKRLTLTDAFHRAGWRTVADVPSNDRTWPEGTTFYHYDKLYDRRDVGYKGPKYSYASMPDEYVFAAFQRLELSKRKRPPLFAEIDLVSSHTPWNRIPRMIPWNKVGDGSIFRHQPVGTLTRSELFGDHSTVRAAYGESIRYSMNALVAFVQHSHDKKLVLVVLGDHQPAKVVSGETPTHNVPISVIAHDPKVLQRISGWGWSDGLRPSAHAPLWPMSDFRDRFLSAFDS